MTGSDCPHCGDALVAPRVLLEDGRIVHMACAQALDQQREDEWEAAAPERAALEEANARASAAYWRRYEHDRRRREDERRESERQRQREWAGRWQNQPIGVGVLRVEPHDRIEWAAPSERPVHPSMRAIPHTRRNEWVRLRAQGVSATKIADQYGVPAHRIYNATRGVDWDRIREAEGAMGGGRHAR